MLAQFFHFRQNFLRIGIFLLFSLLVLVTLFPLSALSQSAREKRTSGFTARLINIESVAKDPFRYSTSLYNGSGRPQTFELQLQAPEGWSALFRTEGSQVAAVRVDSGRTQEISLEVLASPEAKPGKYTIPVRAVSSSDTLRLELEAVVKGNYSLELTTPTGRLSDEVTEGNSRQLRLILKNKGTLPLDGLELTAQSPAQWSAAFEPSKLERLAPGQTQEVTATLSVPDKTIAGDYVTTFNAKNNFASANALFRMTVKTSLLSGWIGTLVIMLALAMVYYLIRKYGRR